MNRIERLKEKLKVEKLDGIFLMNDSNIRYISGFTGSDSYVLVSEQVNAFITDSRYTEQAGDECKDFEVIRHGKPMLGMQETIKEICTKYGIKRLAFEKEHVTYVMHEKLVKELPEIELIPTSEIVEQLRGVKDEEEIAYIRKAAQIADQAFVDILKYIKPGVTEKDIERELQYLIKKQGADDIGFPSIVASGKRTSLPHAIPCDKKIENGDFVTLDFGAMYKGYRSDMTRTVVVGEANDKQREIYEIVKAAQAAASNAIKEGVPCKVVDASARDFISNAGYGDCFGHGLGHGLGLDIHEEPYSSPSSEKVLELRNVVTVEPGIYLQNWGGVRIEDTVVVGENGIEVLTKTSKELITIG
jgi:Xaa-Pro aminopeptidase